MMMFDDCNDACGTEPHTHEDEMPKAEGKEHLMNMPAMEEWVDIHRQVREQKRVLDLLAEKAEEWKQLDDTKGDSLSNMLDHFLKTIGEKVMETIEAGWAHKPVDYSVLTYDGWSERVGELLDSGELTLPDESAE